MKTIQLWHGGLHYYLFTQAEPPELYEGNHYLVVIVHVIPSLRPAEVVYSSSFFFCVSNKSSRYYY